MAVNASGGMQSVGSVAWAQLQQQQAQRAADQAEQNAKALRQKARDADVQAGRAQENARATHVQSDKADRNAGDARQRVDAIATLDQLRQEFQGIRDQIASSKLDAGAASNSASGVTNAYGQKTGTVLDVTA